MIFKTLIRTIKSSIGRFAAILCIVALGVGVYAGLRASEPSLRLSADRYMSEQQMYDARVLSTLGITKSDVEWFEKREYTAAAAGIYSSDAFVSKEGSEGEEIFQLMSMSNTLDLPEIVYGRTPENDDECLGDAAGFSEKDVGKYIEISSGNNKDTLDLFSTKRFRLVGLCRLPRYMSADRSQTDLGSGTVRGFILVSENAFDSEVYHELLLKLNIEGSLYSEKYDEEYKKLERVIKKDFSVRATVRYWDLLDEANKKLSDARTELDEGWEKYNSSKEKAEKELSENLEKLQVATLTLSGNEKALEEKAAELEVQYSSFMSQYGELLASAESSIKQLDDGIAQAKASLSQIDEQFTGILAGIDGKITAASSGIAELEGKESLSPEEQTKLDGLRQQRAALEGEKSAVQAQKSAAAAETNAAIVQLEQQKGQLQTLQEGKAQLDAGRASIQNGRQQISDAWVEINYNWSKYYTAKAEADSELADALKKLDDGEAEYSDGVEELEKLRTPDTYVLGRDKNIGLVAFKNDTTIVSSVSKVFPGFFVLIASLVCITTMARMVNDERTVIGTLKALGYSRGKIAAKYLWYAGLSSVLGCVLGYTVGSLVITYVIWLVYGIMYNYSGYVFSFNADMFLAALAICGLGGIAVTLYSCNREFSGMPAELIRPRAPAKGRRILIERLGFLWKRLNFLSKVTLRNAFRYKKRMLMMLVGIGGCTALLLTGFGIQDSISEIMNYQYDEIMLYDLITEFAPEKTDYEELRAAIATSGIEAESSVSTALCREETVDAHFNNAKKSCTLMIADAKSLEGIINFRNDSGSLAYPGKNEALLSEKLARKLGVGEGDEIIIPSVGKGTTLRLKVSGVFDNYVRHYIFISPESVKVSTPNAMLLTADGASNELIKQCAARIRGTDGVSYVGVVMEERTTMEKSMEGMDSIIFLVILCSGALAFIVLYNLTNINIMERIREIATVKVLGFYPKETAAYVLRENIVLSILGGGAGLYLGKYLHRFVIGQIDVDIMNFDLRITVRSYLLSLAITIVFALITNLSMRVKLNGIPMSDSLKSVE